MSQRDFVGHHFSNPTTFLRKDIFIALILDEAHSLAVNILQLYVNISDRILSRKFLFSF